MFAVGTRSNVTVPATVTAGPVGGGVLSSPPWWQPPRRSTASVVAARRRAALEVILFLRSKLRGYLDNARGAKSMTSSGRSGRYSVAPRSGPYAAGQPVAFASGRLNSTAWI